VGDVFYDRLNLSWRVLRQLEVACKQEVSQYVEEIASLNDIGKNIKTAASVSF